MKLDIKKFTGMRLITIFRQSLLQSLVVFVGILVSPQISRFGEFICLELRSQDQDHLRCSRTTLVVHTNTALVVIYSV